MDYLMGILVICWVLLLAQRYVPQKWQAEIQWSGGILLMSMLLQVAFTPYRVARIGYDLMHLLG